MNSIRQEKSNMPFIALAPDTESNKSHHLDNFRFAPYTYMVVTITSYERYLYIRIPSSLAPYRFLSNPAYINVSRAGILGNRCIRLYTPGLHFACLACGYIICHLFLKLCVLRIYY